MASGAFLTLDNGTTISGGTMTIAGTLEIDSGNNEISNVIVTDVGNTSQLIVSGGVLTLEGDSFSGGEIEITVDSGAELVLDNTHIKDAILDTQPGSTLIIPTNSSIETINSTLSGNNVVDAGASLTLIDETVTGTIDDLGTLVVGTGTTTFDGVSVDDDNATVGPPGSSGIDVDFGGTLTLENNAQIYGGGIGTLTIESGGQLSITSTGATLDGVIVTDSNASDGIDVVATLTLNDGTIVSGGTLTVENAGELFITAGSGGGTEGVPDDSSDPAGLVENPGRGATLDAVTVTDSNLIEVSGGVLTLDDNTQINGGGSGLLTIESDGQLVITGPTGATLNDVTVDDDATGSGSSAGIYVASGILTLDGGTQIQGDGSGTLTISSTGELKITGTGAVLDGVIVTDSGTLEVAGTLELTGSGELRLVGGTVTGVLGTEILDNDGNNITGYGTIEALVLQNGGIIDANVSTKTLTLNTGNTISNESGGTLEATAGGTLEIDDALTNAGQLIAATSSIVDFKGGSIANSNTTDGIEVDGTFKVDPTGGTLELTGSGELRLVGGTVTGVLGTEILDNDGNNITGYGTIEALVLQNGGIIDANVSTKTLTLNTGNTISNESGGTLEATAGGTLEIDDALTNAGQLIAATSSIVDFKGGSIANSNTTDGIEVDGTFKVDPTGGTLELTGSGELRLVGGTVTGVLGTEILDNDGNNITGYGTIEALVLQNGGIIDANVSTKTLTLNTGNTISNESGGTLEATAGGTLEIDDALTNAGQLIAATSSIVDFKGGSIANSNTTDGIEVDGTFKVDPTGGTLELTGSGELRLVGGTVTGVLGTEILDNDGNNITGYGTIEALVLQNGGIIDANVSTKTLTLNTGNTISNESGGTLEATAGGTLEIDDALTNAGQLIAATSSIVDFKGGSIANSNTTDGIEVDGTFKVDPTGGTLTLNGGGAVTLTNGTIEGNGSAETLHNVNNTISGYGTIGGSGLALINDGTIKASSGTLEIVPDISGTGTLQIAGGATLQLDRLDPGTDYVPHWHRYPGAR